MMDQITKQNQIAAEEALRALEQAYEYYAPEEVTAEAENHYADFYTDLAQAA